MNISPRNIATAGAAALIVLAGVFGIKALLEKINEQSDSEIVFEGEVVTIPEVGAYPLGSATFNYNVHVNSGDGGLLIMEDVDIPVSITFYGALDDEAAVEGEKKGVAYTEVRGGLDKGQLCLISLEYKVNFKVEGTFFPRDCNFKLKLLAIPKESKVTSSTCSDPAPAQINAVALTVFAPHYYASGEFVISKGNWDSKMGGYYNVVNTSSNTGTAIWLYGLSGLKLPSGVGCGF